MFRFEALEGGDGDRNWMDPFWSENTVNIGKQVLWIQQVFKNLEGITF